MSPSQASALVGAPVDRVAYHVRVLADYGFLVLRAQQQVRGALKSYYIPDDRLMDSAVVREFLDRQHGAGPD